MMDSCKLALADGSVYSGLRLGAAGETIGEVVFNTSMTGYQEILTDPSYCGQIVVMTYPEIGNYGVNDDDLENGRTHLTGFAVRESSRINSNFRSTGSLSEFLESQGVVGISEIDTRALVRKIRSAGAMPGVVSTVDLDDQSLIAKAKASPGLVGRDLVREVLPETSVRWQEKLGPWWNLVHQHADANGTGPHVVAIDYGMKWNIARHLASHGCKLTILPGTCSAADVMAEQPDGVFLSNGPGDPEPLSYAVDTIRQLLGKVPIFGICLGHQLLGLACGATTFKLKFGHRGANQPVQNLQTEKIEITSQNHGFALAESGFPEELEITHRNLNDNTIAGIRHKNMPAFGVQYHPEASAGPHDSHYLFTQFLNLMGNTSVC